MTDNKPPRMDLDSLNPFYREYARAYENATDAPLEYLITALLPSLGAAISTKRWIQWGQKRIYANFWIMLVGQSTVMRKSTALDIGTYMPKQLDAEHPDRHFLLPNDGSLAGFLEVLMVEKNGILVHSEIATLLENMAKGCNLNAKSLFTSFFDVPAIHKIRHKEAGEEYIREPIFGIAAGTTLPWLKSKINKNDMESGFLARFLYCHRDKKDRSIAIPIPPDKQVLTRMDALFRRLLELEPAEIRLDDAFRERYTSFYNEINATLLSPLFDDGTKAFLGRLQTDYYMKLTILECTLSGQAVTSPEVTDRVSQLINFYVSQAVGIMDMLLKTDLARNQEKVLELLKVRRKASSTEIHRLFNNRLHATNLKATMSGLEHAGLVKKVTTGKSSWYEIIPDSQAE